MQREAMGPTKVCELMSARPRTVGPNESLEFVMKLMLWGGVRHLPVVDRGKLVGLVSERDLLAQQISPRLLQFEDAPVSECMRTNIEVVAPDEDVTIAAARMAAKKIGSLPVVEDDELVGILTTTDILAERGRLFFKSQPGTVPSVEMVMRSDPVCFAPSDPVSGAALRMTRDNLRHVLVVDEGGRLVGIVSDRDLRAAVGDPVDFAARRRVDTREKTVADVMTRSPLCLGPGASLFELASCFLDERVGAVPVVGDDSVPLGIVSYLDLLAYLLGR